MDYISETFPICEQEYEELNERYGQLCEYAAWQLIKKNNATNHTDDQTDIAQELRISLLRAGSYYKRQTYIERCLELASRYAKDRFMRYMVKELVELWRNKTRHGANRQKFGPHQEKMLDKIVRAVVPRKFRPRKKAPLNIDAKFNTYCKAIAWNTQKTMGKKYTREKPLREGQVSLNQFSYLGAKMDKGL